MNKWVEAQVTIIKTYAVEITDLETIEDAKKIILADCMDEDIEIGECLIGGSEMMNEGIKRNADVRIDL